MTKPKPFASGTFLIVSVVTLSLLTGCASWRHKGAEASAENEQTAKQDGTVEAADTRESSEPKDPRDLKIETLTVALSRAQARIEELDAKMAAMRDQIESTKIAVENVAGAKELKTVAVGKNSDGVAIPSAPVSSEPTAKPRKSAHSAEISHGDEATNSFLKGMNLFRKGSYTDAVLAFNQFVENHPDHALAGSAQFYAGESYFLMGEYRLALPEYQKVISSFGGSPRVPSALVRIAHSQHALGDSQEATRFMALASDHFPGNPSLEWPAPRAAAKPSASDKELDASPMEPPAAEPAREVKTTNVH